MRVGAHRRDVALPGPPDGHAADVLEPLGTAPGFRGVRTPLGLPRQHRGAQVLVALLAAACRVRLTVDDRLPAAAVGALDAGAGNAAIRAPRLLERTSLDQAGGVVAGVCDGVGAVGAAGLPEGPPSNEHQRQNRRRYRNPSPPGKTFGLLGRR